MTIKAFYKDILFMLKLASLSAILLLATRAAVGERAELSVRTADAVLQILENEIIPSKEAVIEGFSEIFARQQSGKFKLWRGVDSPDIWACEASGNGMWSEITLVFVIDSSNWKILGLKVVEQNETAGLGSRIIEDEFSEKFEGIYSENGIELTAAKVMNNQFDAISGATVSSKAVERLVNKALTLLHKKMFLGIVKQSE